MGGQQSRPSPPPPPPPPPPPEPTTRESGAQFCERIMFTDEDARRVNSIEDLEKNSDKLQSIQIQRVSIRSYSSSTKLNLVPSIPFKFRFNGQDIDVRRMTLYHPCPVRIENRQYDAVLSLNDPVDTSASHIVLIPLEGVSVGGGPSANFFGKIASYIPGILKPNSDGVYESIDVPTGANWDLTNIIQTQPEGTVNTVKSGYFVWTGEPTFERFLKGRVPAPLTLPDTLVYGWRRSGGRTPTYIMMQYPSKIGSFDLQTIRMLPVTPAPEAIHPIPSTYYYKPGPPPKDSPAWFSFSKKCSKKEKFTVSEEDICDPFAAIERTSKMSTDDMINIVIGVLSAMAVFIGVYFALKYATGPLGEFFKKIGEKLGRAMGGMKKELGKIPVPVPAPSSKLENEQINPMKLTQEQRQLIKKEEPKQPDIRRPERVGDIRKTQRSLDAYKSPGVRGKTMKNKPPVKTAEADKEDIAKLEKEMKDAAGTGLLTPEEMKIPPEERNVIAEELPDEEVQEAKELIGEKKEAEKKLEQDTQKGFAERLAEDRAKVEKIDKEIKERKDTIDEAVKTIRDMRNKTARAVLQEAKRRQMEERLAGIKQKAKERGDEYRRSFPDRRRGVLPTSPKPRPTASVPRPDVMSPPRPPPKTNARKTR